MDGGGGGVALTIVTEKMTFLIRKGERLLSIKALNKHCQVNESCPGPCGILS